MARVLNRLARSRGMAKILKGIDLRDLIDLEVEFGTVLGGPAGSAGTASKIVKAAKDAIVPPKKK